MELCLILRAGTGCHGLALTDLEGGEGPSRGGIGLSECPEQSGVVGWRLYLWAANAGSMNTRVYHAAVIRWRVIPFLGRAALEFARFWNLTFQGEQVLLEIKQKLEAAQSVHTHSETRWQVSKWLQRADMTRVPLKSVTGTADHRLGSRSGG